jgi:hypothetical protein
MTQTVVVDFDGVLHSYIQPWTRADVIKDPPTPGAIEWLNHMAENASYKVVIVSTRAQLSVGKSAIRNWLLKYDCKCAMTIEITDQKPPATMYIDDRAWHFDGSNFPTLRQIAAFAPWNAHKRESARQRAAEEV